MQRIASIYLFFITFIFEFQLNVSISYSQNTWVQKANFGGGIRVMAVAFTIGNKAYAGTGFNGGANKDFWEYNPNTDTWTQKADVGNTVRTRGIAFSIGDKGYIGLGNTNAAGELVDLWEYDTLINVWTQKTDFPDLSNNNSTAIVIGNYAYVCTGGRAGNYYKSLWKYDPSNDSWTRKTDFPGQARSGTLSFSIGGYGYFGFGDNNIVTFQDFYQYNPNNDSWTQKSDNVSLKRTTAASFNIKNKGYIACGLNGTNNQDMWEYDTSIDSWTQKASIGGGLRSTLIFFSIDKKAFVGTGGDNVSQTFQDMWQYTPGTTPSISNSQTSFIADTFALADGTISFDGNYSVTNKGFVWSTSPHPTISSHSGGGISYKGTGNSSFSDTLSGLTPLTLYYYRAYATNSQGTSYSEEFSFTSDATSDADIDGVSNTIENNAPNGGDGNFDGTLDANQANVTSILTRNGYITIQVLDYNLIKNVSIASNTEDRNFNYPTGLINFTIPTSHATVKIFYHNITSFNGYLYRKLSLNNNWINYRNVTFGTTTYNGRQIATATIILTDGGEGDFDGLVNGEIVDPGGPAIAVGAAIPIWDWKWKIVLLINLFIIGYLIIKRNKLI